MFSICGMLLVSCLARRVNFNHSYDGRGNPSAPWLLPVCGAVLLVWLGLHGYFLYQIHRK